MWRDFPKEERGEHHGGPTVSPGAPSTSAAAGDQSVSQFHPSAKAGP